MQNIRASVARYMFSSKFAHLSSLLSTHCQVASIELLSYTGMTVDEYYRLTKYCMHKNVPLPLPTIPTYVHVRIF